MYKRQGYGYKKIGFILDRGYFSRGNIRYLDECGYSFVIMAKGMSSFISDLILENKGCLLYTSRVCNSGIMVTGISDQVEYIYMMEYPG